MKMVKNSIKWGSLILALVSANSFAQTIDNRIMIHKKVLSGGEGPFSFTTSGTGLSDFELSDGETYVSPPLANNGELTNRHYSISEAVGTNSRISDITCILDDNATATVRITGSSLANATDAFDLGDNTIEVVFDSAAPGETVQCTVTNEGEGGIKIIKTATWNKLERLPNSFDFWKDSDGTARDELFRYHFVTADFPANGGDATREIHKFYPNEAEGTHVFYELKPLIPNEVTNVLEANEQWKVTSIDCTCDGDPCTEEQVSYQLDDGTVVGFNTASPADDRTSIAMLTVNLVSGELVICTVHNEDTVCPAPLEPDNGGGAGSNNNNNGASQQGTNAGLATTDVGASAGGCSSTGTGVAGLGTILMLLSSLVGVRAMRRVRVRN